GWLKYQRQKWKIQKQQRVRRRQLFGERQTNSNDAIGTFFRNQAEMIYQSIWQLLQLRETESPGEVRAFVLIDRKIHTIKIIVPRQVYLNLNREELPDVEIKGVEVEKVINHTL